MICYMPEIYNDETVYSWFCRYYVHSGYPYYKYALEDLFIKQEGCPVADLEFIGNLNKDAKDVISSVYPMEELIFKHTMFPQYARFAGRERRNRGFKILMESRGTIRNTLPMPMNKSGARYICYCPLCAQEDRKTYGEAYWHRSYFIRGIGICVRHRCRLINTSIKISRVMPPRLLVADDVIPYEDAREFVEDAKQIAFAEYLSQVFYSAVDMENDVPIGKFLDSRLQGTKYLSNTRNCRNTTLLYDDFVNAFGDMPLSIPANREQLVKLFSTKYIDVLWICELAYFLNISADALCNPILSKVKQYKPVQRIERKTDSEWKAMDQEMLPRVKQEVSDLYSGKGGRPGRVTGSTITRALGFSVKFLKHLPMCKEAIYRYYEDREHTWARRAVWAYGIAQAEKAQGDICWHSLQRLTKMHTEYFIRCLPYLMEYTDAETAEAIKAIAP